VHKWHFKKEMFKICNKSLNIKHKSYVFRFKTFLYVLWVWRKMNRIIPKDLRKGNCSSKSISFQHQHLILFCFGSIQWKTLTYYFIIKAENKWTELFSYNTEKGGKIWTPRAQLYLNWSILDGHRCVLHELTFSLGEFVP